MSDALDLMAALVLEDGRRWGEAAAPIQWEDARAVLEQNAPAPYHWLGRARGYSKTTDNGAIAIVAMLAQAPERARLFALAADQAQGTLLVDAIGGFAHRTPELGGALTMQEFKVIAPRSGATLTVLPADSSSIWGLRPWFAVVDELTMWHETPRTLRVWEGLTTGLAKLKDSRLVVLGTAGDPGHFSYGIRNQALDDPLWRVHEVPGPPPWMDAQRLDGERRRLPDSSFRKLFLNEWVAAEDRLASEDDLAACTVLEGPLEPQPGIRYVIGLDIGLKSDATVAAVCHAEKIPGAEHPRVVLDRMMRWKGSRLRPVQLNAVEEWVEEAANRYGRARIRFDPFQGIHLSQRLKRKGLTVEEFNFSSASVGKLATVLLQLIREHNLALPDDTDLLDELRNVKLRETSPGVYRLDHDRNHHDDRAIALALAASYLVEKTSQGQPLRTSSAVAAARRPRRRRRSRATSGSGFILDSGTGRHTSAATDSSSGLPAYSRSEIDRLEHRLLGRRRRRR